MCVCVCVCIYYIPKYAHLNLHSKLNTFLPEPKQKIAKSPLQRPGQYVLYEALSSSLIHTNTSSLCLSLSQPSHHHQPQASFLHLSAWTPQQPYAIREDLIAAILINIDLVSTYPSGSVLNSRYCISAPTANTTHS